MNSNELNLINDHIYQEMSSNFLYRQLRSAADWYDWPGFSSLFKSQAVGEEEHTERLVKFMESRRLLVEYKRLIPMDPTKVTTVKEGPDSWVLTALVAEENLSAFINDNAQKAEQNNLPAYREFLDAYIAEQVKEVELIRRLYADVSRTFTNFDILWHIDRELLGKYGN